MTFYLLVFTSGQRAYIDTEELCNGRFGDVFGVLHWVQNTLVCDWLALEKIDGGLS